MQQDGIGELRRMLDRNGRTGAWAIYYKGEFLAQQRRLRDAKRVAYRLTSKMVAP